ncbi:FMN-binding protein [Caldisericum exile]|uniref:Ion-translocating oxidoreductase complex subunit G n=1 Tax=Caldisericum exile (strain DSM 21853 / NBRC 104410 / AZM16c01) TaxID=511051 RepID=A0A7U6JFC5_CALEA|nr:FMN-binding protein [Caldisericum exile]BAL81333.1 putative electron transport complex protein RnfG [Caldisericum exile AZM16c01]
MKSIVKFAITLGLIAAITGFALAIVYKITKPIIAAQDAKALEQGLSEIFPGDYEFLKLDKPITAQDPSVQITECYLVKDKASGKPVGMVSRVTVPGSQAPIEMLVGVKSDGSVSGVKILKLNETAGLGANADNPKYYVDKKNKITFLGQFIDKNVIKDKLIPKQDVIAMTGATITSSAVSKGVKVAGEAMVAYLKEAGQ